MAAAYRLTATSAAVIRTADMATIPNDPANNDWVVYQSWLKAGGVPDPAPPLPVIQPSRDAVIVQLLYRAKVTTHSMVDPGNGFIIWDTVAQIDASHLAISARSDDNVDWGNVWRNPAIKGSYIILQYTTNAAQVQRFQIGAVLDKGTWFETNVTPVSSAGGAFAGNNPLYAVLSTVIPTGIEPALPLSSPSVSQEQFAELRAEFEALAETVDGLLAKSGKR
jgi:hypothetical protein